MNKFKHAGFIKIDYLSIFKAVLTKAPMSYDELLKS